jgi:hypothetical protein
MKSHLRSIALAVITLCSFAFLHDANAATISITYQDYTGNAPVVGTPTPASSGGVFSQIVTGTIPDEELSPYYFNNNGTTNDPYSVISFDSQGPGYAIYNVGSSAFTLLWGSPDLYNVVQFFSGPDGTGSLLSTTGASGLSYIGSDLACFSSTCADTLFDLVTFTYAGGIIGSVELSDSNGQAAFEFGVATPLPAAFPLFAGGLGVIGLIAGRRKRKATGHAVA